MPHATPMRSVPDSEGRVEFPEILERLKELGLVEDEEFVSAILGEYVRDSQIVLVELNAAVAARDVKACERLAHRLKGSSLNLGAEVLSSAALAMEALSRSGDLTEAPALLRTLARDFARVTGYLERRFGVAKPPESGTR